MMGRGFGTFWMGGRLSAFEQACLNSFVANGKSLTLFSFEPIENVPENVRAVDAREIVSVDQIGSFLYDGKPHLGHFSDYFRYAMFAKAGLIWVDADILLLKSENDVWMRENIVSHEIGGGFNGAILYFSDRDMVAALRREIESLMHKGLRWGETGPLLLNRLLKTGGLRSEALDHKILYPIHHDEIGRVFLPEYLEWCNEQCAEATALHIFNNVIVRMGYWKDMAPPVGSFLYEQFKITDGVKFFSNTIPDSVMRHIVMNFRAAQTGENIGVRSMVKQAIPSIRRTLRHYSQ